MGMESRLDCALKSFPLLDKLSSARSTSGKRSASQLCTLYDAGLAGDEVEVCGERRASNRASTSEETPKDPLLLLGRISKGFIPSICSQKARVSSRCITELVPIALSASGLSLVWIR